MKYPHLAAQIFNVPLLVHPQKLDAIIAGIGPRLLGARVAAAAPAAEIELPADLFSTRRAKRSDAGYAVQDGVGVIFADGALVHRARFEMADSSYFLGYDVLASQLEAAIDDPDVHAVLQVWDSPGGEAAGAFEYADRIHALRGKKPMWTIADDLAASAAYLGGSAFDRVAVTSTGYLGSIGVVMRHVDFSRALDNDGIRVTHIFAGAHKVDANPYEPLAREVRDDLQAEIDGLYTMFLDTVARNRGLSARAMRETEARTFRGAAAVEAGLADRVATTDELISELAARRSRSHPVGQFVRSTTSATSAAANSAEPSDEGRARVQTIAAEAAFSREDLEHDHPALFEQLRAEFTGAGAAAERERVAAVRAQSMPGHQKLIEQLAADGKTTGPEAAAAVLAAERSARQAHAVALANDAPLAAAFCTPPDNEAKGKGEHTSLPIDQRAKAEWEAKPQIRAEFTSFESYLALRRAEDSGLVRVLGRKSG